MTTPCSIDRLESALAGTLTDRDEDALQHHLEACPTCSAALERMAGGTAMCDEAAALLPGDELDAELPADDGWFDADFTVEHLEPADEPNVLGRLGGYDVLEVIGRGGMGMVLKAFDRELKRTVALKVLAPHLAQSSLARQRFSREAQAAAAVVHPHVMAIHQVQAQGRLPFLVMPWVAGESLAERLRTQGSLELKEVLRIGMQAAAGLAAAHEQGLVHRDVKPANILLERGVERTVLTDFGLARAADDVALTRQGVIAGTPEYMSPEQAKGEALDSRSDLFSLGCVLYEMASGVSPFRADSTLATLRRLVEEPPPALASLNPELPPWFVGIVDKLLEKDAARRFTSAREVSALLERCLAHLQQPTNVALPALLPTPRPARRRLITRRRAAVAAVLLLALGGSAVFLAFTADQKEKEAAAKGWMFGRTVTRTLNCPTGPKTPLGHEALRLEDGQVFNLPKGPAAAKLDEWLAETKVNLVVDYRADKDQWEWKLHDVKLAELPETPGGSFREFKTPSADELHERLSRLEWKQPPAAEAKSQGFTSLLLTAGRNPSVTFAFETRSGRQGILQFAAFNKTATHQNVLLRYKLLQKGEPARERRDEGPPVD